MDNNVKDAWGNFLSPEVLRSNLIISSIYITAYEILKDCIIERIRDFYTNGFDDDIPILNDDYKKSLNGLNASLQWLKDRSVINDDDLEQFNNIKKMRNKLAHEMPKLLESLISLDIVNPFKDLVSLLNKIELWWLKEVEIPTDPGFDTNDVDYDGIIPGSIMTLRLMLDIALGSKEESEYYFDEFKQRFP